MNRAALQATLTASQARIAADPAGALAASGMPSALAELLLALLTPLAAHDDQDEVADLLGELVGKQHRKTLRRAISGDLRAALHALGTDAPLHDAGLALVDALGGAATEHLSSGHRQTMQASDNSQIINSPMTIVQGDQINNPPAPDPLAARQQRALLNYLRMLQATCRPLQIDLIDAADMAEQSPMRLERVYITLNTTSQVPKDIRDVGRSRETDRPVETRPLTALEALTRIGIQHIMLLGAPGSGKSTFVNHLVLCLAAARVSALGGESQPVGDWLAHLPGWTHAPLPIQVILRDFAAFAPLAEAKAGSLKLLLDFLGQTLGAHADALEPIQDALSKGDALLLFDGLDEVVGDEVLARVVESIAAATATYTGCRALITCRTLDYQANPQRHVRNFMVEQLAPLDEEQIATFVQAWYDERTATGRQVLGSATELQAAINSRSELRELAALPLLLTMMAVVHAGKGTLPDARALLYAECIELLLLRWRQHRGEPDLLEQLGLRDFHANDLLRLMARLGYAAHQQAARDPDNTSAPADLTNAQVRRELGIGFATYAQGNAERREELVTLMLHRIATRNGLLLKRGGEQEEAYAFPHRSFQEFLAGYHLSNSPDYDRLCLEHASQIHWHEALRLMVSYQVLQNNDLRLPPALARDLLDRRPLEQALAGELLNLIGRERAASYRPDFVEHGGLWPRAQAVLHTLTTQGQAPEAPATLRVRAGLALGQLCYGELETYRQADTDIPLPDQRLPLAVLGLPAQGQAWWRPALEAYWCAIEAGPFWHGDDREKEPLQQIELPHSYKIGRYPVTNADYARFVAAGGYTQQQWWTDEGWKWRLPGGHPDSWEDNEQPIAEPWLWRDTRYNQPTQPVVGISWYEATAYCNWLSAQGHTQGWLPPEETIRLPTWLEWERAARHTDQRRYPWGDAKPDTERANYQETGIGRPSPVGCFPAGAATCGAMDMVGTGCEWTASLHSAPTEVKPEKDVTASQAVLFSYSDFRDDIEHLCCGARIWYDPDSRNNSQGFRVLWSRALIV